MSAVFADNSSVTSKKYVDDLISGYQGKLPGSGANTLMIYDDETGIGEKSIETTLGNSASAVSVPTVGAVKTGLDGKQDTITGTAGYVMTGTGNAGEVGERAIYSANTNYSDSLVTAEIVNTGVINAVNSSLIRVNEQGAPSDSGTLWEINTSLFALSTQPLPTGYTRLEYIESTGAQYIDTGIKGNMGVKADLDSSVSSATGVNYFLAARKVAGQATRFYACTVSGVFDLALGEDSLGTEAVIQNRRYNFVMDTTVSPATLVIDGETTITNGRSYNTELNMYLFAANIAGVASFGGATPIRIYYAKIWEGNTLVRDFVPAKNSSNVVGMYDTVSGQFFTNQGTGEFTAGPPVGN